MPHFHKTCRGLAAALAFTPTLLAGQAVAGQQDTFEDGTSEGWFAGIGLFGTHPAPPTNIATGGPGGAEDNYLLLTALGGMGSGSRFAAMNASQWAGDYLAAGITGIGMSVRNFGATDLFLRLLFEDPLAGPPTSVAFSRDAIFLPAGNGVGAAPTAKAPPRGGAFTLWVCPARGMARR